MSYSEERFSSFYSRMSLFQKIAAQNGYELKNLLIKKVGVDEELASALIAAWETEQADKKTPAPAGGIAGEKFDSYVRDMGSFQRLAHLQGVDLQDWLKANCAVDDATAQALIKAAGVKLQQKNDSLLGILSRPADEPKPALPSSAEARGAKSGKKPDDDMVITISGVPEEGSGPRPFVAEINDVEAQIDRLHALADTTQHTEPIQLILELKDIRLKKNYLKNSVSREDNDKAERLLRDREEQRKKLLRLETKLEETRASESELRNNPPKLFRREEYRTKIRDTEDSIARIENQIAALTAREAERQTAYLAAVSCIERHAAAQREINGQYLADEEKFKAAKEVVIRALHWAQLDLPVDVLAGSVMERLSWYESFFKTFPEHIDLPVHGWIKAYAIICKLACDYPLWRGKIENIHFVVDNEMKSLKDAIRLFLDGFVAQLKEPFSAVCQLAVIRSEAEKTQGRTMHELVAQRENEIRNSLDDTVLEFCWQALPVFYTIQALAEYLNFEIKVLRFFENPDHGGRRPSQPAPDRAAYAKMFAELAEASARALEACFNATDEIAELWRDQPLADTIIECRNIIRTDFENLFKASRERLKRY